MELFIIAICIAAACAGGYFYQNYKKEQYLLNYEVRMMEEEQKEKEKKAELSAHIREEQKNKSFYLDVILTHGNAMGARACLDQEGRRRSGILSLGDIILVGKNGRGDDIFYRLEEAGMEIWATLEPDELILKSEKDSFEIREVGTPKDKGTRTQKASLKAGRQYYVILNSKHEIGILAEKN